MQELLVDPYTEFMDRCIAVGTSEAKKVWYDYNVLLETASGKEGRYRWDARVELSTMTPKQRRDRDELEEFKKAATHPIYETKYVGTISPTKLARFNAYKDRLKQ